MLKDINGVTLKKMIIAGAACVENNKKIIDALNVFPVPDGDTGTNMSLTLKSTANEVNNCSENTLEAVSNSLARGALKGARGNSGVILSQILKGISTVTGSCKTLTTKVFAKAIKEGCQIAYKAVTKPKEGTMLTVIRVMAEAAVDIAKKVADFEEFFSLMLEQGELILQQTPEMLPVLKKAGVVDAGGRGLIVFFSGCARALSDDEVFEYNFEDNVVSADDANENFHANLEDLEEIQFGYCTEFMVIQMKPKTTESDIDKLRERLLQIGDCVLCIGDLSLVKVHVHTNEPNRALGYALELGEIYNIKIENMLEQNRVLRGVSDQNPQSLKPFGMVAVSPGDGITNVFKDLAVDKIVGGGQSMNPSAEDIANAVKAVGAKDVFVLPNNKNIILAAEQAKGLVSGKTIHVIPTRSIPEGIDAALAFNAEGTLEDNLDAMMNSFSEVKSGAVTYAVRSTHVDGFDLTEGEIIGLDNKAILSKSDNVKETTLGLLDKMIDDDIVNITLFYGADVESAAAEELGKKIEEIYPDCEITVVYGGQPIYYYLISLE